MRELWEELRQVLRGRGGWVDALLPPALFAGLQALLGVGAAAWGALGAAALLLLWRLWRGADLRYALGGVGGVALAALLAQLLGRAEGFFLPTIVTGAATTALAVVSVLVKRPFVAWTSWLARRWPLDWYWHPRVRPAYSEVTWLWAAFFGLRLLLQISLFQNAQVTLLAIANLLGGWPAIVALLVVTYLYGTWRLRRLRGPSVAEFKAGQPPPWTGQRRGF
jgi:hypothetical protein